VYPGPFAIFVAGAIAMGYVVIGLFFLRFWRRIGDRFFLIFSIAFGLLAANNAASYLTGSAQREPTWIYLIRLAAFVLIIIAVVTKNTGTEPRRRLPPLPRQGCRE
jgi:membrane-associated PAP2 superfamily phosphatase